MEPNRHPTRPDPESPRHKARDYHRLKRRLALGRLLLAAFFMGLALSGGSLALWGWISALGLGPRWGLALQFTILGLAYRLMVLPVSVVSGYVVEKRFGMLPLTGAGWARDFAKALGVEYLLGLAGILILYELMARPDPYWWLLAGAAYAVLSVLLAQFAPIVLFPLFFKFKRLDDEGLSVRLAALCQKAGVPVVGVYAWNLSAKSNRANAAVVGWGPTRRVVLSDSLMARFTPSEVEVVLAHELAHHKLGHLGLLLTGQSLVVLLALWAVHIGYNMLGPWFDLTHRAQPAGLPLVFLVMAVVSGTLLPAFNALSRKLETQADEKALEWTGLAGSFISAIERLAAMNLGEWDPPRWSEILFATHPAPAKRVQAARDYHQAASEKQ